MSLLVGEKSVGHEGVKTYSWDDASTLTIGKYCSIAPGLTVYLGGGTDWVATYRFPAVEAAVGSVVIGHDVRIGADVTIMPGVTIGDGAVIASKSLVTKDVPAYALAGGSPAEVLRLRLSPEKIALLLEARWWDWPEEKVAALASLLSAPSVDELLVAAAVPAELS